MHAQHTHSPATKAYLKAGLHGVAWHIIRASHIIGQVLLSLGHHLRGDSDNIIRVCVLIWHKFSIAVQGTTRVIDPRTRHGIDPAILSYYALRRVRRGVPQGRGYAREGQVVSILHYVANGCICLCCFADHVMGPKEAIQVVLCKLCVCVCMCVYAS